VVKFYETGDLSQNKAAEILGVSRQEFIRILSSFKVSILDYDKNFLEKELSHF
jgi:predicted HTH domain antitoxin